MEECIRMQMECFNVKLRKVLNLLTSKLLYRGNEVIYIWSFFMQHNAELAKVSSMINKLHIATVFLLLVAMTLVV